MKENRISINRLIVNRRQARFFVEILLNVNMISNGTITYEVGYQDKREMPIASCA